MSGYTYIEYRFILDPVQPTSDILSAELGEVGFESFVEEPNGILAYIKKKDWNENLLEGVNILGNKSIAVTIEVNEIAPQNWNASWEENFQPILVDGVCSVRAPFHEKKEVPFDIVIEPKMSFGTGHHETTHMMLQLLLPMPLEGKSVLDMGCGTGVLAILAGLKGAKPIDAVDIDNWCYQNALENVERNGLTDIEVAEGDAKFLEGKNYDVIIANINRNILLEDIPNYASCLNQGGSLLLSGFYVKDLPVITDKCLEHNLHIEKNIEKNNWVAAKFLN